MDPLSYMWELRSITDNVTRTTHTKYNVFVNAVFNQLGIDHSNKILHCIVKFDGFELIRLRAPWKWCRYPVTNYWRLLLVFMRVKFWEGINICHHCREPIEIGLTFRGALDSKIAFEASHYFNQERNTNRNSPRPNLYGRVVWEDNYTL